MSNHLGMRFASFFQAGFECSSHRRRDGVRLDLIRATGHDKHVLQDYRTCRQLGFAHAPGRAALASDRESAGPVRLVELAARARSRREPGVAGHLGPVPLRLARSCRPGRRRLSRSLYRLRDGRARGAAVGQQTRAARLPAERDQLHVLGGGRRLFPAGRAGSARLVQATSSSARGSPRQKRSASAGPGRRSSGQSR